MFQAKPAMFDAFQCHFLARSMSFFLTRHGTRICLFNLGWLPKDSAELAFLIKEETLMKTCPTHLLPNSHLGKQSSLPNQVKWDELINIFWNNNHYSLWYCICKKQQTNIYSNWCVSHLIIVNADVPYDSVRAPTAKAQLHQMCNACSWATWWHMEVTKTKKKDSDSYRMLPACKIQCWIRLVIRLVYILFLAAIENSFYVLPTADPFPSPVDVDVYGHVHGEYELCIIDKPSKFHQFSMAFALLLLVRFT